MLITKLFDVSWCRTKILHNEKRNTIPISLRRHRREAGLDEYFVCEKNEYGVPKLRTAGRDSIDLLKYFGAH